MAMIVPLGDKGTQNQSIIALLDDDDIANPNIAKFSIIRIEKGF
jgi:hypothetical protein